MEVGWFGRGSFVGEGGRYSRRWVWRVVYVFLVICSVFFVYLGLVFVD